MKASQLVLLDTCSVVNLYATRNMGAIVGVVAGSVAIVDVVERESQFVRRGGDGPDADERERVDLLPVISTGAIRVLTSDDDSELMTFIDLTQALDDGEAMSAAIAIHRYGTVVTDDQKASRILRERGVPILTTLDLCKNWAESVSIEPASIRAVLVAIRERGRHEPPRAHPLRGWWDAVLGS